MPAFRRSVVPLLFVWVASVGSSVHAAGLGPDINLNLHVTPASYSGCDDPVFAAIDEGDCASLASAPVEGPAFVWVVASLGEAAIGGLQFGVSHAASVEGWSLCTGGLEIAEEGWPGSGTGNAVTWPDGCYDPSGDNARVGFLRVPNGSSGQVSIIEDPRIGGVVWADCAADTASICEGLLAAADLSVGTVPLCGPFSGEAPPAPTAVTATSDACPVRISWDHDGDEITGFVVFRDGIEITSTDALAREVIDPSASRETHDYTVVARGACLSSAPSVPGSGGAPPLAPATDLLVEDACDGPFLTWVAGSGARDGFRILRDGGVAAAVDAEVTSFRDEGGSPGHPYTYEVVAFDACGDTDPSNAVEGTRLPLPLAAGELTASIDRCDVVRVTWNDRADDELGYDVVRDDEIVASLPPDAESYDDESAAPWASYAYSVVVRNECGERATGDVPGYRRGPPGAVTELTATTLCGAVRLRWSFQSRPESELTILRDGALLDVLPDHASVYDDSTAVAGVEYHYEVSGRNACGEGPSDEVVGLSTDAPPPAVASVTATDDRCDGVLVSWVDEREDETGFRVLRDGSEVAVVGPDVTDYHDTGMDPSTPYAYSVVMTSACGDAEPSEPDLGTWFVPDLLAPPELLGPVQGDTCLLQPFDFRWTSVPDATGYRVRVGSACGLDDLVVIETSDTTATTWDLPQGIIHWQVETANACGAWGDASTCQELDVMPALPAPTILEGHYPDDTFGGLWDVSWEPVPGAERYLLRIALFCHEHETYSDVSSIAVAGTDTTLDVSDYEHALWGIEFWAWVSAEACGALGDSTACLGPGCCGVPVLLEAFEGHAHGDAIELTWRTGGDRATGGFDLWRRDDRDPVLRRINPGPVQGNGYTDRSARPGRTYTYQLREIVPGGPGVVLGDITVRWADVPRATALWSSPNPFNPKTTLHVELAREGPVVLEVFDPTGRLVRPLAASTFTAGRTTVVWDGRDERGNALPSGLYYARLTAAGTMHIERLALVR